MIRLLKQNQIIIIAIILALCSITYELLLSNTLAIVTADYVWWQAMTIGVYIGGLGAGAFRSEKVVDSRQGLIKAEIGLAFLGAISVIYIYTFHSLLKYYDSLIYFTNGDFHSSAYTSNLFFAKFIFFVIVQSLVFLIGFFSGFEVPLLMRIQKVEFKEKDGDHKILAFNYIGTLIGTLAFAYFFLPKLDVLKTSIVIASINLLVCIYTLMNIIQKNTKRYYFLSFLVSLIIIGIGTNHKLISQRYLKFFYYHQFMFTKINVDFDESLRNLDRFENIERYKSEYQYVDILRTYINNNIPDEKPIMMALDHRFQFSTNGEVFYHQTFSHIPIALNGTTLKNVLVLGGGDGLLVRELLKYDSIQKIKIIELDQKVVDFANGRFAYLNKSALKNPKVELVINDAFYVLRNFDETYDAIFIDFPHPNNYDLAKLYSVEFYKYVLNALNPNGFIAFDAPLYNKTDGKKGEGALDLVSYFNERHFEANSILVSTLYFAGFRSFFPIIINKESFMFAKRESGAIEYSNLNSVYKMDLRPEILKEIEDMKAYNFPYEISEKFINSIFHPVMSKSEDI